MDPADQDIDLERTRPTKVFFDNQSARELAMNPVHHQRLKASDIKYHWIRDMVASKAIMLIDVRASSTRSSPACNLRHVVASMHAWF